MKCCNSISLPTHTLIKLATILVFFAGAGFVKSCLAQTKIVILPMYTEAGVRMDNSNYALSHYRQINHFITERLIHNGFEVVSPYAIDAISEQYNHTMMRAQKDATLTVLEMTRTYSSDIAYLLWLDVSKFTTADGMCKVVAALKSDGYNRAAKNLRIGLSRTLSYTRSSCHEASMKAEEEVAELILRKMTTVRGSSGYKGRRHTQPEQQALIPRGGILQEKAAALEHTINIKLMQVTEPDVIFIFDKLLQNLPGVTDTKNYQLSIRPENPQASYSSWRVRSTSADTFQIKENLLLHLNKMLDSGAVITDHGISYKYPSAYSESLKAIREHSATSREIVFVIDRKRQTKTDGSPNSEINADDNAPRGFD